MKPWNAVEKSLLIKGIPDNFIRATWKDFNFKERDKDGMGYPLDYNDFNSFLNNDELRGFFFYGPSGSGKTFQASLLAKELNLSGKNCLFRNARDFKNEYIQACKSNGKEEIINKYSNVQYLVINDLCAERTGEGYIEGLFSIIDNREIRNKYKIVVTSNLTYEEIKDKVMDRIPSRLHGLCGDPHTFPNIDWRNRGDRFNAELAEPVKVEMEPKKEEGYVTTKEVAQVCFDKMGNLGLEVNGNKWISMYENLLRSDQVEYLKNQRK